MGLGKILGISKRELIVIIPKSSLPPIWELRRVRQGRFLLVKGKNQLTIEDTFLGADEIHPISYEKEDSEKIMRFLNIFYKGSLTKFNWKTFDRIERQLKLTTGRYHKE